MSNRPGWNPILFVLTLVGLACSIASLFINWSMQ